MVKGHRLAPPSHETVARHTTLVIPARVASSPHESRRDGFICTGRARLDQLLPRRHKTTPKRFFLDCLPGNRPVFLHQLAPPTRIDPHDEMDAAKDQTSRVIWPVTLTTFS